MTPQTLMESWFRLMNEAMRGNTDAQDAIKSLTMAPTSPDQLMRWMTRFMPAATGMNSPVKPEVFENWLDEYWRMMGVVPRHRYLELLERHEITRSRLEESEKTIRQLQGMLGMPGQQQETQKVIDMWGSLLQNTMQAQMEWMHTFTGVGKTHESPESEKAASTSESPASAEKAAPAQKAEKAKQE